MSQHIFAGLIFDESDQPVEAVYVGSEPMYVVNDAGFRRHIPAADIDRQVLKSMTDLIEGHEDLVSEQTAKMLGQDDPFSLAAIESQIKNFANQLDALLETGIPEEVRAYLGMMGFRIRINHHGEILDVDQPGMVAPDDE